MINFSDFIKSVLKDVFGLIISNDNLLNLIPKTKNITTPLLNISVRHFIKSAI